MELVFPARAGVILLSIKQGFISIRFPRTRGVIRRGGHGGRANIRFPRTRGENRLSSGVSWQPFGSPPRVRGKHGGCLWHRAETGITPARAGKTPCSRTSRRATSDHPRACGENQVKNSCSILFSGSPPRVRGKHAMSPANPTRLGITPARAGKTCCLDDKAQADEDHPRACGEN